MTYKTATVRNRVTLSGAIALFITRFSMVGIDYLTIIPRGRVGYEMIDSQRGA